MKRIAHIEGGKVVNVSLWDGATSWQPDENAIEIPDDTAVIIGWSYQGGLFVAPEVEVVGLIAEIASERDRRLRADFEFNGVMYQRDPISVQRIAGAAQLASLAIAQGAQPGDLHWHGGGSPFGWIASDDTVTPMDAHTVVQFGMAAAARETQLIFAARALRQMDPIPDDFADDKWWP